MTTCAGCSTGLPRPSRPRQGEVSKPPQRRLRHPPGRGSASAPREAPVAQSLARWPSLRNLPDTESSLATQSAFGRLPLDQLEIGLQQAGHGEGLDQRRLHRPGKQDRKDEPARRPRAGNGVDHRRRRGQHDKEDEEGEDIADQRDHRGIDQKRPRVLAVKHQRVAAVRPRVLRPGADQVGKDHLVDQPDRHLQEGADDAHQPVERRDRQERGQPLDQPGNGAENPAHELVETEQHVGLAEALLHDRLRVGDLAAPLGQVAPVEIFDHHRDMTGLDHVKDVFAQEIEHGGGHPEADAAAPEGGPGAKLGIAEGADAPADPGADAGDQHIGHRDAEIDQHAEDEKRRRAAHQRHGGSKGKIGHVRNPVRLKTPGILHACEHDAQPFDRAG